MNLTYIARINPDLPCTVLFDDDEWKILYCAANRTMTSLREVQPPEKPYTIAEAVKYVGWLGGPKTAPATARRESKLCGKASSSYIPCLTTANCLILWVKFSPRGGVCTLRLINKVERSLSVT
jgi:hypothetical protein